MKFFQKPFDKLAVNSVFGTQMDGRPTRTRTLNGWTKTSCVANYTMGLRTKCHEGTC